MGGVAPACWDPPAEEEEERGRGSGVGETWPEGGDREAMKHSQY